MIKYQKWLVFGMYWYLFANGQDLLLLVSFHFCGLVFLTVEVMCGWVWYLLKDNLVILQCET